MRVTVRGWARDHGQTVLMNDEIEEVPVKRTIEIYPADTTIILLDGDIELDEIDGVRIIKKITARMSGDYMLTIKISSKEILRLAWLAWRKRSWSSITQNLPKPKVKEIAPDDI